MRSHNRESIEIQPVDKVEEPSSKYHEEGYIPKYSSFLADKLLPFTQKYLVHPKGFPKDHDLHHR